MRIALITLAVAALAFIGSIIYSLVSKSSVGLGPSNKTPTIRIDEPADLTNVQIDIIKTNQKLYDKVEQLEAKIDMLTKGGSLSGQVLTNSSGETMNTENSSTSTTGTVAPVIKISGKFLALVMPTVDLKLQDNKGIFDLFTFESIPYSTYFDAKIGLKVTVIDISYESFLKNMRASVREVYSINENKTFSFASFYVNPIKPDTLVRMVTEFENQTIALEIPKTKFPILKALLTKKETPKKPIQSPLPKPTAPKPLTPLPTNTGTTIKK